MADKTFKMAGGTVMRVTAVDACGVPQNCSIVSRCVATVQITPQYVDPQDLSPVNMDGSLCWVFQTPPQLKWEQYTITLNAVNLRAWAMLTGAALYFNEASPTPEAVGVSTSRNQVINANAGIELWKRQANEPCVDPTQTPYVYWVGPWITQGKIGEQTVGNSVVTGVIEGARSGVPSPWGVGPYNVERFAAGVNAGNPRPLLTAIGTTQGDEELSRELVTTLPPPAPYDVCLDPTSPVFSVTPTSGASPLLVTGTFPLYPGTSTPILPARIDWGDATAVDVVTSGTTKTHTYATPGTRVATFTPTAYSSPNYVSASITAS
jgi:hypothetical protein